MVKLFKLQNTYEFNAPLTIDKSLRSPNKTGKLPKLVFDIHACADKYASLSRYEFKLNREHKLEKLKVEGYVWKTALKVMTYVLTLGILPLYALLLKIIYKDICADEFKVQPDDLQPEIPEANQEPEFPIPLDAEEYFPGQNKHPMTKWPLRNYADEENGIEAQLSRVTWPFHKFTEGQTTIFFKMGNIIRDNSAVLVNAANAQLISGAGVCGSFFDHAGQTIFDECAQIKETLGKVPSIPIGQTVMTTRGDLQQFETVKAVLHTVSPKGSDKNREKLMEDAIFNSLKLAAGIDADKKYISKALPEENKYRSISFPALGTGIYNYPKPEAARIAAETIKKFIEQYPQAFDEINFVFSDDTVYDYIDAFNAQFQPANLNP